MYKLIIAFAAGLCCFILWIIYLANTGGDIIFLDLVHALPYGDKVGHVFLFGFLTFTANLAFRLRTGSLFGQPIYFGTAIVSLFVLIEEFSQAFLPSRTFDWLDLMADMVGITLFTVLSSTFGKTLKLKDKS